MSERPCVFTYRSEDDHSLDKCRCGHYLSDHDWPPKPFDYEADWKRLSTENASLLARLEQAERRVEALTRLVDAADEAAASAVRDAEARVEQAERERDEARHWKSVAERALAHLSPNGRPGVQLYLDEDSPVPCMPMFGIIETYSPFIVSDEPNEAGARDVYQWRYDEESFSLEHQHAGMLIDDEWVCDELEKLEADRDAWKAKAEARPEISPEDARLMDAVKSRVVLVDLSDEAVASISAAPVDWRAVRGAVDKAAERVFDALRDHARKAVTG